MYACVHICYIYILSYTSDTPYTRPEINWV